MNPEEKLKYKARLGVFYVLIGAMVAFLVAGMAHRQLVQGAQYSDRGKVQNHRRILVPAPRGQILDRHGRVLVGNKPKFSAVVFLSDPAVRRSFRLEYLSLVRDLRERGEPFGSDALQRRARANVIQGYLDDVNRMIGRDVEVDSRSLSLHFSINPLLPFPLVEDLDRSEFARLVESLPVESPVQVNVSSARHYPYENLAAHTLGYVASSLISPEENLPGEELRTFATKGSFGRNGIEKQYDERLQGRSGMEIWVVDPAGFQVERVERKLPEKGEDVYAALDVDLQLAAEEAFGEKKGALVALDLDTAETLALVSKPDFDLNRTSPSISQETFDEIEAKGAWLHRATQGLFPPGSPFKLVTAIAALNAGAIDPQTERACPGYHFVGRRRFPCHNPAGHGEVDLREAIRVSCNVYFYKIALETGADAISREAIYLGLDKPTGIDLPYETARMIAPTREWKRQRFGEPWYPGDTANLAIGQGFLRATPLQLALVVASIAKNQVVAEPSVLRQTAEQLEARPEAKPLGLPENLRAALVEGMERAVLFGTGRASRLADARIAGKTGTAQVRVKEGTIELGWFVAFAPVDNPKIALCVLTEGQEVNVGYGGGINAAPIAQAVLKAFFEKRPDLLDPESATAAVSRP